MKFRLSQVLTSMVFLILAVNNVPQASAVFGGSDATGNPIVVGILPSQNATLAGCSGALVAPQIIFTAAHCLTGEPSQIWISQPGSDLRDLTKERIQANRLFLPSDFTPKIFPYQNDFGIITLKSAFVGYSPLSIASLEDISRWTSAGDSITHIGYGCTALVDKPPCKPTSPTPNQFTTTFEKNLPSQFLTLKPQTFSMTKISVGKTICGGDSGSPVLKIHEGNWIYVGAQSSSNGAGCTPTCEINCVATQGLPAVNLEMVQEAFASVNTPVTSQKTVQKKVTITCVKGKSTKKVTALKPVCPNGYKKK